LRTGNIIFAALPLVAATALWLHGFEGVNISEPDKLITDPDLPHPSDIVQFKGHYVATELYANKLVIFDDDNLSRLHHFDPESIGKHFKSPHFLAVSPRDTLLISNGWGRSIVEIEALRGNGWKEFRGIGKKFRAPHGICVDEEGWIYVGDSLNSRLVRFRDMDGADWQVFRDVEKRVSYIRELVCQDGAVWASNSYENREGLNPGTGSNVLKITDFESGVAEAIHHVPGSNMTGLAPLSDSEMLIGLWGTERRLALVDVTEQTRKPLSRTPLGVPYGSYVDQDPPRILVTHVGDVSDGERRNLGGIAVYYP